MKTKIKNEFQNPDLIFGNEIQKRKLKLKNKILKSIMACVVFIALITASMLDSVSYIPFIVLSLFNFSINSINSFWVIFASNKYSSYSIPTSSHALLLFLLSACMVDSDSYIPYVILVACTVILIVFMIANWNTISKCDIRR